MTDRTDFLKARMNVFKVGGYIPLSLDLIREIEEENIGPVHGPPEPPALRLRRDLDGRPFGPYRRAT